MYNKRDLSKGTGSSSASSERKEWYSYSVSEKRYTVSAARTNDMEIA